MGIDHTCIYVPEAKARECLRVYLEALKPLGYELRQQYGEFIFGLGSSHDVVANYKPADFWVCGTKSVPENPAHIAFRAKGTTPRLFLSAMVVADDFELDRPAVDAFHAAAIQGGGEDNGPPGLRPYHSSYYAAFFKDPAGNNIEAVCHDAQ
ncbi:hypothetical protein TOPH_04074 [Tolypocladium ophioglossoides CBS 100239]|uniref:VOC domain-containing protein n=1 Tax=Tolypocladium ophioglossoides (strain CBS 100239) TaxID=1163406 RepID=A0A0L0NAW2_TOLOC|nr:hypothetical protein TOPH_04074 [Tolypocladium ophioglossoides CBS 100239]